MKLKDLRLGERCRVHITPTILGVIGFLTEEETGLIIPATVIAKDTVDGDIRLGWKVNEVLPGYYTDNGVFGIYVQTISNMSDYPFGNWRYGEFPCLPFIEPSSVISVSFSTLGHICSRVKCGKSCPDAMHDASKSPFVCYECRLMDRMRGE